MIEVSQRLEQHARDKANARRPRPLKLIESDEVMVAEVEPRNKLAARWTGPHVVVRCLSAHRYEASALPTRAVATVSSAAAVAYARTLSIGKLLSS